MKPLPFFITCPKGLVELLEEEISGLGATVTRRSPAGIWIEAHWRTAMAICLWSRLGSRVIRHLGRFDAAYAEDLKRAAASLSWEDWLVPGTSFRVSFQGTDDNIRNSHFGAQCIKDGVLDRMSATGADRPSVEGKDPDLPIHARLHRGKLELGMDLAGASLHRRVYRTDAGEAPLRENLAAALLHRAGWPAIAADNEDFVDPLCGSGTLLIEAAMMATDSAPGLSRSFAFERWPGHDAETWQQLRHEAEQRRDAALRSNRSRFRGSDRDRAVIRAAWHNIERAGLTDRVHVERTDLADWALPETATPGLILTNPPYGERLKADGQLARLYQLLGERVRACATGWRLGVFTGVPEMGHQIGLRSHRQYRLFNGALEASLLLFEVNPEQYRTPQQTPEEIEDGKPRPQVHDEERARMLSNRLRKNRRVLRKRLRNQPEARYRLYDADIPEFAVRVEWENGRIEVRQYTPPASMPKAVANERLAEALAVIPEALEVAPEDVHFEPQRLGR